MNISGIGSSAIPGIGSIGSGGDALDSISSGGGGFSELLDGLGDASALADQAVTDVATGADADLHDVTLAVEMESLAFDLAVQIRNRLVDAYQEVFRMQI